VPEVPRRRLAPLRGIGRNGDADPAVAGIGNELYTDPRTAMYFADAKKGFAELAAAVKVPVG
jgi:hypothetical protein